MYKPINILLWTLNAVSMLIIALFWLSETIINFRTISNIKNNVAELTPFCPQAVYELLFIFNCVVPTIIISHVFLVLNSYFYQRISENSPKIIFSFLFSILLVLGLFSQLSNIGTQLGGAPLFSTLWWWPFSAYFS